MDKNSRQFLKYLLTQKKEKNIILRFEVNDDIIVIFGRTITFKCDMMQCKNLANQNSSHCFRMCESVPPRPCLMFNIYEVDILEQYFSLVNFQCGQVYQCTTREKITTLPAKCRVVLSNRTLLQKLIFFFLFLPAIVKHGSFYLAKFPLRTKRSHMFFVLPGDIIQH